MDFQAASRSEIRNPGLPLLLFTEHLSFALPQTSGARCARRFRRQYTPVLFQYLQGNLPLAGGAGWRSLHHYQDSTLREARVAVLRVVMWQPQVPKKPNEIWRSPAQHSEKIYFVICKAALSQSADGVGRAKRFAEDAGYRRNNRVGHRLFQIRH